MKHADPLLAELYPTGKFGGARPRPRPRVQRQPGPDPDAGRHLAALVAAVREIDHDRGYGVNRRYRSTASERNAA